MGWRYRHHVNGGLERHWEPAKVYAVGIKQAYCVKLTHGLRHHRDLHPGPPLGQPELHQGGHARPRGGA